LEEEVKGICLLITLSLLIAEMVAWDSL
jgi:hypothetical protein